MEALAVSTAEGVSDILHPRFLIFLLFDLRVETGDVLSHLLLQSFKFSSSEDHGLESIILVCSSVVFAFSALGVSPLGVSHVAVELGSGLACVAVIVTGVGVDVVF